MTHLHKLGTTDITTKETIHGTTNTITFKLPKIKEVFTLKTFFHGYYLQTSTGTELLRVDTNEYALSDLTSEPVTNNVLTAINEYVSTTNDLYTTALNTLSAKYDTVRLNRQRLERGTFTITHNGHTRTILLRKEVTLIAQVKIVRNIIASAHISERKIEPHDKNVIEQWLQETDIFELDANRHKHYQLFTSTLPVRY